MYIVASFEEFFEFTYLWRKWIQQKAKRIQFFRAKKTVKKISCKIQQTFFSDRDIHRTYEMSYFIKSPISSLFQFFRSLENTFLCENTFSYTITNAVRNLIQTTHYFQIFFIPLKNEEWMHFYYTKFYNGHLVHNTE